MGVVRGASRGGRVRGSDADSLTAGSVDPATGDATAVGWNTDPCAVVEGQRRDRASPYQWHLPLLDAVTPAELSGERVTVAVLDTGVAYEDRDDETGTYRAAPSLSDVAIVAPYDFVNGDPHANDDHQHGTHIASTIASRGRVEGVAPGATLMPLKVLDANNQGSEVDLVDAIHHAVAHGADVLNLSLSFHPLYQPSPALRGALTLAPDAGVLMVGASGNSGLYTTTWPAAHPDVIAVASSGTAVNTSMAAPSYSNRSAHVALSAPGGDLDRDANGDGVPDGIVAETIDPADPTAVGMWAMAGTSQSAAVVSGIVATVLAADTPPSAVLNVITETAWSNSWDGLLFTQGRGAGVLSAGWARKDACGGSAALIDPDLVHASVMPVIGRVGDGQVEARAQVSLTDALGGPLPRMQVHATIGGTTKGGASCVTDLAGRCELVSPPTDPHLPDGSEAPVAWSVSIDNVVHDRSWDVYRARPVLWSSDALELLVAALDRQGLSDTLIALDWQDETDPELGDLAAGFTVLAAGTGLSSSPLGLVFNRAALGDTSSETAVSLDLDGTGLSSSPLGLYPMTLVSFDGSGFASSPLGFADFQLVSFSGTGLSSSPLGFRWDSFILGATAIYDDPALSLDGGLIDLSTGTIDGASVEGSALSAHLEGGGWMEPMTGLDGARLMLSTVAVQVEFEDRGPEGSSSGALSL